MKKLVIKLILILQVLIAYTLKNVLIKTEFDWVKFNFKTMNFRRNRNNFRNKKIKTKVNYKTFYLKQNYNNNFIII